MRSISLSFYILELENRKKKKIQVLGDFDKSNDFLNFLNGEISALAAKDWQDIHNEKIIGVFKINANGRSIEGLFKGGGYGYQSEIKNVNTSKITHTKTLIEAEVIPYYFQFIIPKDKNQGLLIFQRFGVSSMKNNFHKYLNTRMRVLHPKFQIKISPFVDSGYLKDFFSTWSLKKLRLIKYGVPKRFEDGLNMLEPVKTPYKMELSIYPDKGKKVVLKHEIEDYLKNPRFLKTLLKFDDMDFDEAKFELSKDKKTKTINVSNIEQIMPYYDITDRVSEGKDNFPSFSSLQRIAKEYKDEFYPLLYGEDSVV